MKIMVPANFYVAGGVERVMFCIIKELAELDIDIVIILPQKSIDAFQQMLPNTARIIYETSGWPRKTISQRQISILRWVRKFSLAFQISSLDTWALNTTKEISTSSRLRFLAKKHQCTHCLYFLANRVPVPKGLALPLATLSHDLFWRFAPMTYPHDLIQQYDNSLKQWLESADKVITVSNKTRQDLLTVFPGFEEKVEAVPLASDRPQHFFETIGQASALLQKHGLETAQTTTFFFPSSFSLYKDHLTLMRASIHAFEQQAHFKILMTGKDTDRLAKGDLDLSKQKKTLEYQTYVEQLQQLYADHAQSWSSIFWGAGYCDLSVVEAVYQTCSCVVMPSRYEGFGLAISEAIVRGIPVIAADIDVFHEQVALYQCPDRVRFFESGNPEALSDRLQEFLTEPLLRLSEAETSQRFDHWTWRRVAQNYIDVLSTL